MANEAGQGAANRGSTSASYTFFSDATASISGNCDRLAAYISGNGGDVKFAFFSLSGSTLTRETSVITVTAASGDGVQEFNAPGDFTAFAVTAGWYLGVYVDDIQTYNSSGGVGFWYINGDSITPASCTPAHLSSGLDDFEADITAGGSSNALPMAMDNYRRLI